MALQDDFNESADDWYTLVRGSYAGVPRADSGNTVLVRNMLRLVVADTPALQDHAETVEAALLILSQSPHARQLAQIAIAGNYSIRIGAIAHDSDTADASGYTDHLNRRIYIAPKTDENAALRMALGLAHELAHVAQQEKGFEFSVLKQQPAASIRELLALEGDARAHEFIVALELAYKSASDPDERLLFPNALDVAADTIGSGMSKKVIEHFRPQFPDIDRDEMMARIFKSFYASIPLRAHYEGTILKALEKTDATDVANPALFQNDFDAAATLKKLGGYAEKSAKYLALDSPQMAGITAETLETLAFWQQKRDTKPVAPTPKKAPAP